MGNVVSNTADILAILGGATTLIIGIFGAIRLSRCQTVRCCWGCIDLINKPLGDVKPFSLLGAARPPGAPPGAPPDAPPGASLGAPPGAPAGSPAGNPSGASLGGLTPSNSEGYISPIII